MASTGEIRRQIESEIERRSRLGVPAFAGGVLYLLSAIIISGTLKGAPTVGLLQGIAPALSGETNPPVSPRADEVKFISHHSFALIAGSTLAAVAIGALTLILLLLADATRFRRASMWAGARPLVLYGGGAVALVSLVHQIISAIETHGFAVGADHSNRAVEQALTTGTANVIVQYLSLLSGLALAGGMITVMLNAQRVGLVPRWVGILGIFTGLLIFLPIGGAQLQIIPALWMVMIGILFVGRWPTEPPAWVSGEARPWPSGAAQRAARQSGAEPQTRARGRAPARVKAAPAPAPPTPATTAPARKRRRKRGGRG